MPFSLYSSRFLLWFVALALLLIGVESLVIHSAAFTQHGQLLPAAVTIDLLVGLPLLCYFFVVRPYRISVAVLWSTVGAAAALTAWLLPPPARVVLYQTKWLLALAEPLVLGIALWRLGRLVRAYRKAYATAPDVESNLAASFTAVFGRPLMPLVSELVMLRYSLFFWLREPAAVAPARVFTAHRNSAVVALFSTLLAVSVVEMVGVHLLVRQWQEQVALGLLVFSLYGMLFLIGHLTTLVKRPTLLYDDHLRVRIGLVWNCQLPRYTLVAAQLIRDAETLPKSILNLAKPTLTPANVLLTWSAPVTVTGIYGIRKESHQVAVYVDEPNAFLEALQLPSKAQPESF